VNPQPITDESIDALLEVARPSLRQAMRNALEHLEPVGMMPVAIITLPSSGNHWNLFLAVMIEPVAALLQGGFPAMQASFSKTQPSAPPVPPTSGGLMVPGE
jgi:hypothetical protein